MKSEKRIREELKDLKELLKAELKDKDYCNISDTAIIINWLEWILDKNKLPR